MELTRALTEALDRLLATGRLEVRENDARLAALDDFQYEVRQPPGAPLLHLWSGERNLVRRVHGILENAPERLALEVERFGHARPDRLEFVIADGPRNPGRVAREQFRERFRDLLARQFPDEKLVSLTTAADLRRSLSGSFARGVLEDGRRCWAVLGAGPGESAATYDGLLTFGLLWLDHARQLARRRPVAGLRLFFPTDTGRITAHRLQALSSATIAELYAYSAENWRAQPLDPRDAGNLDSWLAPRREIDALLADAAPAVDPIRRLAPGAIESDAAPESGEVTLRFRGLSFVRWRRDAMYYGAGDPQQPLLPGKYAGLEKLVRELKMRRSPVADSSRHPLYRAQPERWLQSLVAADPGRVDPRLDPKFLYAQVPAIVAGDRGVMDLLGVTRGARLAVVELKASEDIQMVLQAVDYWLRVRWHHAQQDFSRYGYFPGLELDPRPPLLFLVAPSLRFHPTSDALLRHLNREIVVCRVGVSESWRRGLKVVLRQGAC
jgi:hypothetical protein